MKQKQCVYIAKHLEATADCSWSAMIDLTIRDVDYVKVVECQFYNGGSDSNMYVLRSDLPVLSNILTLVTEQSNYSAARNTEHTITKWQGSRYYNFNIYDMLNDEYIQNPSGHIQVLLEFGSDL